LQVHCRGSRRKSAVAQLFSLGHETCLRCYERFFSSFAKRRIRSFVFARRRSLLGDHFIYYTASEVERRFSEHLFESFLSYDDNVA
jgi:hypothetical protein